MCRVKKLCKMQMDMFKFYNVNGVALPLGLENILFQEKLSKAGPRLAGQFGNVLGEWPPPSRGRGYPGRGLPSFWRTARRDRTGAQRVAPLYQSRSIRVGDGLLPRPGPAASGGCAQGLAAAGQ